MGEGAGELAGLGMLAVAVHSGTCSVNSVRLIYRWARDDAHMILYRGLDINGPRARCGPRSH